MLLIKRRIKRQPKPLSQPQSPEESKSVVKGNESQIIANQEATRKKLQAEKDLIEAQSKEKQILIAKQEALQKQSKVIKGLPLSK